MRYCKECGKPLPKNAHGTRRYCNYTCRSKYHNSKYSEGGNRKKVVLKLKKSDYTQNIKSHCVFCGKEIPGTWKWYQIRGNSCVECSVKAEKDWRKRLVEIKQLEKVLC